MLETVDLSQSIDRETYDVQPGDTLYVPQRYF